MGNLINMLIICSGIFAWIQIVEIKTSAGWDKVLHKLLLGVFMGVLFAGLFAYFSTFVFLLCGILCAIYSLHEYRLFPKCMR